MKIKFFSMAWVLGAIGLVTTQVAAVDGREPPTVVPILIAIAVLAVSALVAGIVTKD